MDVQHSIGTRYISEDMSDDQIKKQTYSLLTKFANTYQLNDVFRRTLGQAIIMLTNGKSQNYSIILQRLQVLGQVLSKNEQYVKTLKYASPSAQSLSRLLSADVHMQTQTYTMSLYGMKGMQVSTSYPLDELLADTFIYEQNSVMPGGDDKSNKTGRSGTTNRTNKSNTSNTSNKSNKSKVSNLYTVRRQQTLQMPASTEKMQEDNVVTGNIAEDDGTLSSVSSKKSITAFIAAGSMPQVGLITQGQTVSPVVMSSSALKSQIAQTGGPNALEKVLKNNTDQVYTQIITSDPKAQTFVRQGRSKFAISNVFALQAMRSGKDTQQNKQIVKCASVLSNQRGVNVTIDPQLSYSAISLARQQIIAQYKKQQKVLNQNGEKFYMLLNAQYQKIMKLHLQQESMLVNQAKNMVDQSKNANNISQLMQNQQVLGNSIQMCLKTQIAQMMRLNQQQMQASSNKQRSDIAAMRQENSRKTLQIISILEKKDLYQTNMMEALTKKLQNGLQSFRDFLTTLKFESQPENLVKSIDHLSIDKLEQMLKESNATIASGLNHIFQNIDQLKKNQNQTAQNIEAIQKFQQQVAYQNSVYHDELIQGQKKILSATDQILKVVKTLATSQYVDQTVKFYSSQLANMGTQQTAQIKYGLQVTYGEINRLKKALEVQMQNNNVLNNEIVATRQALSSILSITQRLNGSINGQGIKNIIVNTLHQSGVSNVHALQQYQRQTTLALQQLGGIPTRTLQIFGQQLSSFNIETLSTLMNQIGMQSISSDAMKLAWGKVNSFRMNKHAFTMLALMFAAIKGNQDLHTILQHSGKIAAIQAQTQQIPGLITLAQSAQKHYEQVVRWFSLLLNNGAHTRQARQKMIKDAAALNLALVESGKQLDQTKNLTLQLNKSFIPINNNLAQSQSSIQTIANTMKRMSNILDNLANFRMDQQESLKYTRNLKAIAALKDFIQKIPLTDQNLKKIQQTSLEYQNEIKSLRKKFIDQLKQTMDQVKMVVASKQKSIMPHQVKTEQRGYDQNTWQLIQQIKKANAQSIATELKSLKGDITKSVDQYKKFRDLVNKMQLSSQKVEAMDTVFINWLQKKFESMDENEGNTLSNGIFSTVKKAVVDSINKKTQLTQTLVSQVEDVIVKNLRLNNNISVQLLPKIHSMILEDLQKNQNALVKQVIRQIKQQQRKTGQLIQKQFGGQMALHLKFIKDALKEKLMEIQGTITQEVTNKQIDLKKIVQNKINQIIRQSQFKEQLAEHYDKISKKQQKYQAQLVKYDIMTAQLQNSIYQLQQRVKVTDSITASLKSVGQIQSAMKNSQLLKNQLNQKQLENENVSLIKSKNRAYFEVLQLQGKNNALKQELTEYKSKLNQSKVQFSQYRQTDLSNQSTFNNWLFSQQTALTSRTVKQIEKELTNNLTKKTNLGLIMLAFFQSNILFIDYMLYPKSNIQRVYREKYAFEWKSANSIPEMKSLVEKVTQFADLQIIREDNNLAKQIYDTVQQKRKQINR